MKKADVIAGLSVAGLMLPEAIAYAAIAGVGAGHAVLAAIAGCLVYPLFGRSRFAIVAPTSSSAAILAAEVGRLSASPDLKTVMTTAAVGLVGVAFVLAGVLRLGGLTGFVSRPVLRGFAFGLAITIILRQMPLVLGVEIHAGNLAGLAIGLVRAIPQWHVLSLGVGAVALVALLALRRTPWLPGALIVLAAGITGSVLFDLPAHGVTTVGRIDIAPQLPKIEAVPLTLVPPLAELVLPLLLILLAESWGTMRSLALRHGEAVDANRELKALGLANIAAALVQGLPVGAGFSAGSASEGAGARTRWTAVVAAVLLVLLTVFGGPVVAALPEPVLAAVVVAALTHSLDPRPILRLWRLDRDQYIALGAAAGVLVLGVVNGMIFAIVLSIAALVRRIAQPRIARLGRLGDSHDFVDVGRHPEAMQITGLTIWRASEPLFFANAEPILSAIAEAHACSTPIVVVSLEESFDLDSTALDALLEFDARMRQAGVTVRLARVRDHVRELFARGGALGLVERCHYSVDGAVEAALADRPAAFKAGDVTS